MLTFTGSVEAIANGVAFEATSRKGLRKRFLIESINNRSRDSNAIYFFDDQSELTLQDDSADLGCSLVLKQIHVAEKGIGGLSRQIALLNRRIARMIGEVKGQTIPANFRRNGGILFYGPSGTGKSLLLEKLAQAPWRKVVHINRSTLPGTKARNQVVIGNAITTALANQPCVVIMDDIHRIAGSKDDDDTIDDLVNEFVRLRDTRVLVVATAPHPSEVDSALRCPGRFEHENEVPVPDVLARADILISMHGEENDDSQYFARIAEQIAQKTHGYVGRDLWALYRLAQDHAIDRHIDKGEWTTVTPSTLKHRSTASIDNANMPRPSVSSMSSSSLAMTLSKEIAKIELNMADLEYALPQIRPTAMKEIFLEVPQVPWSQIGGSEAVKQMMAEVIEWPLKRAVEMLDLRMPAEKGVLLYGPPGCSKTLTAKAVATSSGLNFIAVKGAELTSMYVGESERAVREVFRKAKAAAPAILFFDEIDSIAAERDTHGTKGLNMLTTILNEMDGFESLSGVLILAATNKPEILDSALLRPGRFDTLVYIGLPNEAARREILKIRTDNVPLASDVDLDNIAARTDGFSGAEVVHICSEAAKETMRRRIRLSDSGAFPDYQQRSISEADFEIALAGAVRRVSPEMVQGYLAWRDGLRL